MSKLTVFIILSLFAMSLALYGPDSKVVKLTSANFREKVINSKELWFVEFYAPWCGHCKNLAPEWDKLAKSLEGIIRVGAVDMDADREAGAAYGIQGFPTIKFFGADKNKPTDYNGGRSANDLLEFGLNQAKSVAQARLKGKASGGSSNQGGSHGGHQGGHGGSGGSSNDEDVVVLTEGNFDELLGNSEELWIVEFYAPWCGHCKRLEPEWNAAATKLKGEVKIAKVDATVEGKLAQRFGVQGYPTIKMFPSGPKADHLAENYEGGRDADSIASYALEKKAQFKPAARVVQLTGQSAFDEQCGKNRGICLITFVPHLLDSSASERQDLLDVLAEVAKSQRKHPVTYLWAQGGDYYDIEEKFTLGSGYPAVVAVSVSKSKYAILRASFNKKNLESFIGGLLNGKESLFNLPAISFKNVKEWDGKDAEKPKEDDL